MRIVFDGQLQHFVAAADHLVDVVQRFVAHRLAVDFEDFVADVQRHQLVGHVQSGGGDSRKMVDNNEQVVDNNEHVLYGNTEKQLEDDILVSC